MNNKFAYLLGVLINGIGDGIQQVTIMWYIYTLTGEAYSIGLMIAVYYLPSILLTPFVSVYVDHHDSKKIVVITDIARFILVFGITVLIILNFESTMIFYFLQFLLAVCYTVYKPASQAFVKESFYENEIPYILSKSASLIEAALIAGTGISGLILIELPVYLGFLINSLTFLIASILFMLIKRVNPKVLKSIKINYMNELVAGWSFINCKDGMKTLLLLSILNSISIQMSATLFLPLATQFKGSSGLYSLFEVSFAIGGIVAGLIVIYFLKTLKHTIIVYTMAGMMLSSFVLSFSVNKIVAIIMIFTLGLFTITHLISIQTLIQINTPKEFIGRVVGVRTILASSIKVISALLTGMLITMVGVNTLLLSFSLFMFGCLMFFKTKHIRRINIFVEPSI